MMHVFISHVEEDSGIAVQIAKGLESSGYSVWYYERDSVPGPSYILQTGAAIEESMAVVLIISADSISSHQISKEVIRAHESGKPIIPLLKGMSHLEFQSRQSEWRQAIGAATSVVIPHEGVQAILPRIIAGLEHFARQDQGIDQIELEEKMLYAFCLPAFLISWKSYSNPPKDLQHWLEKCCSILALPEARIGEVTNEAGVFNDSSILRHLPALCLRYLRMGTTIAQACMVLKIRDGFMTSGVDWRRLFNVARRNALQQAEGLFPAAVLASLDKAFSWEDPGECLAALKEWHQIASATLGSEATKRRRRSQ